MVAMRCPYCGSAVQPFSDAAGTLWCPACGNTGQVRPAGNLPPPVAPPPAAAPGETPGLATAALFVGIAALVVFPLSIFLGPVALVLGFRALAKLKRMPPGTPGNGFAIGGLVMGAIAVLVGITIVMAAVVFVLVSNLAEPDDPAFAFDVDAAGTGGTLSLASYNGTEPAYWSEYEVRGEARCTLPNGTVDVDDRIVCVTDGTVELVRWSDELLVFAATV